MKVGVKRDEEKMEEEEWRQGAGVVWGMKEGWM